MSADENAYSLTPWIVAGIIIAGLLILVGVSATFRGSIHG